MKVIGMREKHPIPLLLPVTDLYIEVLDGAIQKKQKNCQYYETKKIEKNPFEND
jgi:hypothetical protein